MQKAGLVRILLFLWHSYILPKLHVMQGNAAELVLRIGGKKKKSLYVCEHTQHRMHTLNAPNTYWKRVLK